MSIQLKRSLSSQIDRNYVLKQGQLGIDMPGPQNVVEYPYKMKIGDGVSAWQDLPWCAVTHNELLSYVHTSRTINNKALTSDISLTYSDVGAAAANHSHSGSSVDVTQGDKYLVTSSDSGGIVGKGHAAINVGRSRIVLDSIYNFDPSEITFSMSNEVGTTMWHIQGISSYTASQQGLPGAGFAITLDNSFKNYCGTPNARWNTVYASTNINTSDASEKSHIQYLSAADTAAIPAEDMVNNQPISLSNIIEFLNKFEPATFLYEPTGEISMSEATEKCPEYVQLGMIANDYEDDPIFPFIGCRNSWEESEAGPAGSILSLKPMALTTVALTACKYLLQRVEMLEEQLEDK